MIPSMMLHGGFLAWTVPWTAAAITIYLLEGALADMYLFPPLQCKKAAHEQNAAQLNSERTQVVRI